MKRLVAALSIAAAASLLAVAPASATTTSFACTGASGSFTVPAGITSLAYTVKGAGGGNGGSSDGSFWSTKNGGSGGSGASYSGSWTVTPGQVLTVKVGCKGNNGGNNQDNNGGANGGWGWFNGGKGGNAGGRGCAWWGCSNSAAGGGAGGGGASGISLGSVSVVAGGGGGGGGAAYWSNGNGWYGTTGTSALANGNNGDNAGGGNGGGGGAGGGGGNGGTTNGGSNGGNGGQNGRSAAGTDSALSSTYAASGGSGGGQDGSVSITYFSAYTFSGAPTGTVTTRSATLSFSTPDANTTFECKIDDNGWGACSSPRALAGAPDGSHSFAVRPKDAASNTGPEKSASWVIDATAPPVPTISSKTLIGKTKIKSQAISFATTEQGSIYSCSIDGAAYSTCTSPMTVSAAGDGAHTFAVRASDSLGNTSDSTAVTWTVDGTAPVDRTGVDTNAPGAFLLSLGSVDGGPGYPCAVMGGTIDATSGSAYCDGPAADYTDIKPTFAFTAVGGVDGLVKSTSGTPYSRTCGITAARTVRCGGQERAYVNGSYTTIPVSTGDLPGIANAIQIAGTGMSHYCVLIEGGSVKCFGIDAYGQVSGSARIIDMQMPQGVPSNGAKVLDNQNQIAPTAAPINTSAEPAIAVATGSAGGEGFSCALGNAGSVNCWGAQVCSFSSGVNPTITGCTDSGSPRPANKTVTGARSLAIGGGDGTTSASEAALCAAMNDDTVKCWGKNTFGTLGDGTVTDRSTPTTVTGLTGVKDVFVSTFTTCALLKDGGVKCWGSGEGGTLGDGKGAFDDANGACSYTIPANLGAPAVTYKVHCAKTPVAVTLPKKATDLTMGAGTVCAKLEDRSLYCWGSSFPGSSYNKRLTPTKLDIQPAPPAPLIGVPEETSGTGEISFIGLDGASFKCAIDDATAAACTSPLSFSKLAGGLHTITVTASNAAGSSPAAKVTWNVDATPPPAPTVTRSLAGNANTSSSKVYFNDAESGVTFKCGVAKTSPTNTSMQAWIASYTTCTSPYTANVAMASDAWNVEVRIIAVDKFGNESAYTPVKWTLDGTKSPTPSATANPMTAGDQALEGFSSVSSQQSSCAVSSAGTARCWGVAQNGNLGKGFPGTYPNIALDAAVELATGADMTPDSGIAKIAVGGGWACSLSSAGTVKCWGLRSNGNLGDGYTNNSTAVSSTTAVEPQGLPAGVTDISAGNNATCALASGEIWCWGSLYSWKSATPAKVAGISTAVQVSVGGDYACARLADKTAKCWGYNNSGQLGISNSVDPQLGQSHNTDPQTVVKSVTGSSPKSVTNLTDIRQISTGSNTACAIIGDAGNVWCWGDGTAGQTGDKTWLTSRWEPVQASGVSGAAKISVGWNSACALLTSGGVKCWGQNDKGQLGNGTTTNSANPTGNTPVTPTGLSGGVTDLSVGVQGGCAVLTGGNVKCWGSGSYGSLGAGGGTGASSSDSTTPVSVLKAGPGLPRVGVPRSPVRTTSLAVQFAGDSGATFSCSLDGGSWADCTSPYSATSLDDGVHVLSVKQTVGGLTSKAGTVSWVNDLSVVSPVITLKPDATTSSTSASFDFTGPNGASFLCSIDSGAYSACDGPKAYSALGAGAHTFGVKATKDSVTSDAATYSWTVIAPPAKPTVNSPAASSWQVNPSVTFSSDAGSTYECSVDGGTLAACTSPKVLSGLSLGDHSFAVKATKNGLTSATETKTWKVADPITATLKSPVLTAGATTEKTLVFEIKPNRGSSYGVSTRYEPVGAELAKMFQVTGTSTGWAVTGTSYSLDSSGGTTTVTLTAASPTGGTVGLKVKANGFTVAASGPLGGGPTGDYAPLVDYTVPTEVTWGSPEPPAAPTLSGAPASLTAVGSASISFTSTAATSYTCSVDGGSYSACTSPKALTDLADGSHSLGVKAVNNAGSSAAKTAQWTVDATAPSAPTLTGAPTGSVTATTASVAFSSTGADSYTCSLDGAAYDACTSPKSLSGLTPGAHTFSVKAKDPAGNISAAGSKSWAVVLTPPDTTPPPVPSLTGKPASLTQSTTASLGFTSEDGATFKCSVDGANFSACTSTKDLTDLADGAHSFAVKAIDASSNESATANAVWTVDTAAPLKPVISGAPSGFTKSRAESLVVAAETGSAVSCSVDDEAWSKCTSPIALDSSVLTDGAHSVRVRATDPAGNASGITTAAWTVDTLAPSVTLSGAPHGTVTATTASIAFTTEQAATVTCSIDEADYAACTSPIDLTDLTDGEHSVSVKAEDLAGNMAVVKTDAWTVDSSTPDAPELVGAPSGSTKLTTASIAFNGINGATFKCSVDGGAYAACTSPKSLTGLADGNHRLLVIQTNAAGTDSAPALAAWNVNRTAPSTPTVSGVPTAPGSIVPLSLTLTADAGAKVLCSVDGGSYERCSTPYAITGLAAGPHTLLAKAVDAAGNVSGVVTKTWTFLGAVANPSVTNGKVQVYKKSSSWYFKVGAAFATGGDPRTTAALLTVQIWEGTTKPSDSLAIPARPTFADGIVAWAAPEVSRSSKPTPTWVRVGNKAGKWSVWAQVQVIK